MRPFGDLLTDKHDGRRTRGGWDLAAALAFENRLDVDDRGSVDGLEGVDLEPVLVVYAQEPCAVEADGVGAVGGAGGEDSGERVAGVGAGVDLEGVAVGLVEPGEDPDLVAGAEAFDGLAEVGEDLEGGGGGA